VITPQSDNWKAAITTQPWRKPIIQAHIEGIPDIVCTEAPPDEWSKTYAIGNAAGAAATDNVTFGTSTALNRLPDWTIVMWYRFKGAGGASGMLVGSKNSGSSRGFGISLSGGNLCAEYATGTTQAITTSPSDTAWHFVAVSVGGLNASVTRAIVDSTRYGPFYDTATTYSARNTWTAATAFHILGNTSVGNWQNVEFGYLAVFNRALTLDEMAAIKYRRIDKKLGNDDSEGLWDDCVAEWRMERGTGTNVVNNRNPGTHDGTINNSAAWASSACFTVTYRPILAASATSGQSVEPLATRTSISSNTLQIADTDEWFTALIATAAVGILRRNVRIFLGFEGLKESEYQCVFAGRITDLSCGPGNVYELSVSDAIFETKTRVTLGRGSLQTGITNASTTAQVEVGRYFSVLYDCDSVFSSRVRIDDEIIGVPELTASSATVQLIGSTASAPKNLQRGNLSSTAASHSAGAVIQELWTLFNITPTYQQPMFILLNLLLSSAGFLSASDYDTFVESAYTDASTRSRRGRGAGMSPSDVAVAEIVALASLQTIQPYVEEDIDDLKDWIEREILRGCGRYFAVKPDGRLTVRKITVPTTGDVVHILTPDRTIRARLRMGEGEIVNFVSFEYDYNPLTQDMEDTYIASDVASGAKYGLRRRAYELPATAVSTDLVTLATTILQRYASPTVLIEVECGCYESLLEVGDAVLLIDFHLPNFTTGHRGVTNILCQVVDRQVDHVRGRTNLTLVDCSRM